MTWLMQTHPVHTDHNVDAEVAQGYDIIGFPALSGTCYDSAVNLPGGAGLAGPAPCDWV